MMCDWDGYALNRNNYRIYNDPVSRKIVFMPHGLDQMFGVMRASTDMPLFPRMSGLVARGLLQTAQGRRQYREQIVRLMDSVYKVDALTNRAWQLAAQLRPALAERGPEAVRSHEREVRALCARITARAENIRDQLSAPETTLQFDAQGTAPLAEWRPRGDYGKPVLEETAPGPQKLLHISAENGSCVGVWSTRVRLEPGQYRFVGKVRCQGVVPDAGDRRGGVGLRTAGRRFAQKLTGTSDWTEIVFDFDIGDNAGEFNFMAPIQSESPDMELICELRARAGEAWFDQGSLRLMRR
jgi:hypothetical protein